MSGLDENRPRAGSPCSSNVCISVPYHPATRQIEIEITRRLEQHSRLRFTAFAARLELRALARPTSFRMMRTIVEPVEISHLRCQPCVECGRDLAKVFNRHQAFCQIRLIGDADRRNSALVNASNRRRGSWKECERVRTMNAADLAVQHAITIEENRRPHPLAASRRDTAGSEIGHSTREAVRSANILCIFEAPVGLKSCARLKHEREYIMTPVGGPVFRNEIYSGQNRHVDRTIDQVRQHCARCMGFRQETPDAAAIVDRPSHCRVDGRSDAQITSPPRDLLYGVRPCVPSRRRAANLHRAG